MDVQSHVPVIGIVRNVTGMPSDCCSQMVSMITENGPVNIILSSNTLVIDSTRIRPGMQIAAFYDQNRPVPLIFPPQFRADVVSILRANEMITLKFFDQNLTASDSSLSLNIGPATNITTANGQRFDCRPGGHTLLVYYTAATRSLPPQTSPRRIVVLC